MVSYRIVTGSGVTDTVTAFDPTREQPVLTATRVHPHFEDICAGLERGDDSVLDLFDVVGSVTKRFAQITRRVSWDGERVLFDGDEVNSLISEQLEKAIVHGTPEDYTALAKFWEKLESNPNEHSKTMAYEWLASHDFKITAEGDVIGYKGVTTGGTSTRQGHAFVDGKEYTNAYIPNEDGTVVTMPRSEVAHDPNAACHTGLHIGDWSFASHFAQRTKRVHINPADIVSVPGHANKMRVCRYEVIEDVHEPVGNQSPVWREGDVTWKGDVGYVPS